VLKVAISSKAYTQTEITMISSN